MSVPTEGPWDHGLYLLRAGTAETAYATNGMLRATSVKAAMDVLQGTADQALATVDALTPGDIGAAPASHTHTWGQVTGKPANFPPTAHASTHATGGPDAVTPADIGAAPASHTHPWGQVSGKPATFPPSSHTHTPDAIGAIPATHWLRGTGSPEGRLAAPVGTVYTDTDATFGAVEWTKFTGTGTTGWRVTKGDTGEVNITASALPAGTSPASGDYVTARRTTDGGVTFRGSLAARASWPSRIDLTVPRWARPSQIRTLASIDAGIPSRMIYATGDADLLLFYGVGSASFAFAVTSAPAITATPWRTA